MQKAFDLIVERLEVLKELNDKIGQMPYTRYRAYEDAIEIVNQVAEEYKTDIEFAEKCVELAEKMNICDLVAENQRLSRKIMFLEAEKENNNSWIPCSSGKMPVDSETVIISTKTGVVRIGRYTAKRNGFDCKDGFMYMDTALAWQPLPQPYQPKGE